MIRPATASHTASVLQVFSSERAACLPSGHLFRRQFQRTQARTLIHARNTTLAVNISCAGPGDLVNMAEGGSGKDGGRDLDG
jgi:hypothetical protein